MRLLRRHIAFVTGLAKQAPADCWKSVLQTSLHCLYTSGVGYCSNSAGRFGFKLDAASDQAAGRPEKRQVVFLLHGICRSSMDMALMAAALRREGFEVVNWRYPSTRLSLEKLADRLAEAIEPYRDCSVDFVTHSMGGIVVRTCLVRYRPANVRRLVMIGTPNQGAFLADLFGDWMPYRFMLGPAGQQLRQGSAGGCTGAGLPSCEYGVIAGGLGRPYGMNPVIPGDNDGTVSVESTRMDGMKDFELLPYGHTYIQMMPRTVKSTIRFLRTGRFAEIPAMRNLADKSRAGAEAAPARRLFKESRPRTT